MDTIVESIPNECYECHESLSDEAICCEGGYCSVNFPNRRYCRECMFASVQHNVSGQPLCKRCVRCFCVKCSSFTKHEGSRNFNFSKIRMRNLYSEEGAGIHNGTIHEPNASATDGTAVICCNRCLSGTEYACHGCDRYFLHNNLRGCDESWTYCIGDDRKYRYYCQECLTTVPATLYNTNKQICPVCISGKYRNCLTDDCSELFKITDDPHRQYCEACLIIRANSSFEDLEDSNGSGSLQNTPERQYRLAQADHYGITDDLTTITTERLTHRIRQTDPSRVGSNWVVLTCQKVKSKLRIRFHCFETSNGTVHSDIYNPTYNCQFPRAIRHEGRFYCVPDTAVQLHTNRSKNYYRIDPKQIIILADLVVILSDIKIFRSTECVVCMDTNSDVVAVPCGHQCICSDCFGRMGVEPNCPLCRRRIEQHVVV